MPSRAGGLLLAWCPSPLSRPPLCVGSASAGHLRLRLDALVLVFPVATTAAGYEEHVWRCGCARAGRLKALGSYVPRAKLASQAQRMRHEHVLPTWAHVGCWKCLLPDRVLTDRACSK